MGAHTLSHGNISQAYLMALYGAPSLTSGPASRLEDALDAIEQCRVSPRANDEINPGAAPPSGWLEL